MRRVGIIFDNVEAVDEAVPAFSVPEDTAELSDEEAAAPDEEVQPKSKRSKKANTEVKEE